jgi:bifunctional non-homologous end joining protein LigD
VAWIEPMLATNARPDVRYEWAVEPKLDGWRTLVYVDGGLRVRTRRGRVVTESVPELTKLLDAVPDGTVLDGELVAGQGRASDFYRLGPQMARRRRPAIGLTFVAFDVLHLAGEDTTQLPWRQRRRLLEILELQGPAWCTVTTLEEEPEAVLTAAAEHELEGLVLKRADSRYEPGRRSRSWLKMKTADWRALHEPMRHER